ncbi:MAG: phosphoribosylformylglycinamidine synthase subunit PurL [Frankiales bacterium]|nr:phosphoribosylformylglycinamidine synthase subunit PurL [Frankiales bacterium]
MSLIDTVPAAISSPEAEQPYAALGLKDDEYAKIREILGRRPTSSELAMYSVMWSEHCSYKSSKVHLRQFGEKVPANASEVLLIGMGENAGVVDVGNGLAVTFKIESHNHPSYVEPHQGAATGVGGIVRDILTMGARPIAVMDPLRFGAPDHPDTGRLIRGIVEGIGSYGNCLGLPNIGGEVVFDPSYNTNPLVNALCVGVLPADGIQLAKADGPGNKVVLFGSRTGGDGIGGASVLASATFDEDKPSRRPAVQMGDPFAEKLLIECCMEIFAERLVVGIQDLGAAGLSCATTELAAAGTGGMDVDLDLAPLRDPTLVPEEILMSESQERMMAVVTPANLDRFVELCHKWGVTATVIGTVTDTGRLVMRWHGETIVDVPPRTLAHDGPVYDRPYARPEWQDALQADTPDRLARPATGDELKQTLLTMVASPNLASKRWVWEQYDRYVMGNTVLAMPEDAGILRLDETTSTGIALATDGNGRFAKLDPYAGAQLALAEAYRNVSVTGGRPIAATDCLNFGSPEDPDVMWQFAEATRGLADACQTLGTVITGGNVSFYNQTGSTPINPTPVVGVLGLVEDVRRRTRAGFRNAGDRLLLIGETRDELGGSEWAWTVHEHLGGLPPRVDLAAEQALGAAMVDASNGGLVTSAHDLSDGGLAQVLVESCLRHRLGARVTLPGDPFVALFSESTARALVTVPAGDDRLTSLLADRAIPYAEIGVVTTGESLDLGVFAVPLDELNEVYEGTLPRLFAHR